MSYSYSEDQLIFRSTAKTIECYLRKLSSRLKGFFIFAAG